MTTQHKAISLIAGDDWFLNIQLTDSNGIPYDIDDLDDIHFLLHNSAGEQLPDIQPVIRTIDAADGRIQLWFPHEITTELAGDIYIDWVRIVCDGIVSTLLTGPVQITADPWRAPVAVAETVEDRRLAAYDDVLIVLDARERITRRPANDDEIPLRAVEKPATMLAPNISTLGHWRRHWRLSTK